jgi:phage gpG-like protein
MELEAEVVNFNQIKKMMDDFIKAFGSARVPLSSVLTYWHKWNASNIFGLSGPGQYKDIDEAYKDYKEAAVGFIYPILKFDGVLEASVTSQESNYAVVELGDDYLIMGTSLEYALYHQNGTDNLPQRQVIIKTFEQLDKLADVFFQTAVQMYNNIQGLNGTWTV